MLIYSVFALLREFKNADGYKVEWSFKHGINFNTKEQLFMKLQDQRLKETYSEEALYRHRRTIKYGDLQYRK